MWAQNRERGAASFEAADVTQSSGARLAGSFARTGRLSRRIGERSMIGAPA